MFCIHYKALANLVKVTLKGLIYLTFCMDHCFYFNLLIVKEKISMEFNTACSSNVYMCI